MLGIKYVQSGGNDNPVATPNDAEKAFQFNSDPSKRLQNSMNSAVHRGPSRVH